MLLSKYVVTTALILIVILVFAESKILRVPGTSSSRRSGGRYPWGSSRSTYPHSLNNYFRRNSDSWNKFPHQQNVNGYEQQRHYHNFGFGVNKAVAAGLAGSALGSYLGYQLNNMNQPYNTNFHTEYSVTHHYHRGNRTFATEEEMDDSIIRTCSNVTFCIPNTQPFCLTNGTIYCLTPISVVTKCNNSSELLCLNTTLTVPRFDPRDTSYNEMPPVNIAIEIPCLTNVHIFGSRPSDKLQTEIYDGPSTLPPIEKSTSPVNIADEYCVTVIADPISEKKELPNNKFVKRIQEAIEEVEKLKSTLQEILDDILIE